MIPQQLNANIEIESPESGSPEPVSLTEQQLSQYSVPVSILGQEAVAQVLNVHWFLRKSGLQQIQKFAEIAADPEDCCNAVCQLLAVVLEDSRETCCKLTMNLYESLIDYCILKNISHTLYINVGRHIGLLLLKLSDMNSRIQTVKNK